MYSELRTCPNTQMWFNSEPTTTEDLSTILQMYTCGPKVRQTTTPELDT